MERYVYRRRSDGIYVFNLGKTWEKLQLAARVIVAIENPQDINVISARPYGQRAVLKFANYTGAKATVGRHTPGERHLCCQEGFDATGGHGGRPHRSPPLVLIRPPAWWRRHVHKPDPEVL